MSREQDLYDPIKAFLEGQGYEVKAEVGACDVVAVRGCEPVVVVELKSRFNLELILQAVDRVSLSSQVYVAFADEKGGIWRRQRKRVVKLCRMLGIGVLLVRLGKTDKVTAALDPQEYKPKINPKKRGRMLKEFSERVGDPNTGGVTRTTIMTSYRQDALRLVHALNKGGEQAPAKLRDNTGIERAGLILRDNHYGWFERVRRGIYELSPQGHAVAKEQADIIATLIKTVPKS
ncbi:MAG: hypothetical protein HN644_03910 [Rhodospirillales bacterium]|nr:hypothetical protein [Rhodospirillales bacterium]MBT4040292.1 hypothetical protein [Rhodospirillales bacterium]MBT4626832.1 hypothetical protein [Rhodospirillales bacterium]MBT5350504.1 hypothetical protein [Rhodospirillales bacterium]MBT5520925.1 hypothetical protein [Rhodospirillales bacterium]